MSHAATSWAGNLEGLPVGAKLILMLLAECHNGKTGRCDPSMDWLCRKTGFKTRMLLRHIGTLEGMNLVERKTESLGRAKGKKTCFVLKIGTINEALQVHSDTGVLECTCNAGHLEVHSSTCALYKEEPEGTGNTKSDSPSFEDAWKTYQTCKLKAGQTKKLAKAQWPKAVKKAGGPERILKAIQTEVAARKNPDGFIANLPDMHRWLKNERWDDVESSVPARVSVEELTRDEWANTFRHYVESGTWLIPDISPPPNHPDCKGPPEMIEHYRKLQERAA